MPKLFLSHPLATVVNSDFAPMSCRSSAYSSLLQLVGRSTVYVERTFPEGVEWTLIEDYLKGQ